MFIHKVLNKLLRIVFALGFLGVLILGGLVGLAYVFEDEIVQGVQIKINQQLETKVDVKSMEFSMLERFPYASVKFNNVWIEDKVKTGDTLVSAEEVYLSFNMLDIISKEYTIRKAEVKDGTLNMKRYADGEENYIFWKSSEGGNSAVTFAIDELRFDNIKYLLELESSQFQLAGHIADLNVSGVIDSSGLQLENDAKFALQRLTYQDDTYIENQFTTLRGEIVLNSDYSELKFNDYKLVLGELDFPLKGKIFNEKEVWNLDLATHNQAPLKDILTVLSDEVKKEFDDYALKGDINYNATLKGAITSKEVPIIKVNFDVKDARVKEKNSGVVFDQLAFKGQYQNLQKSSERITIDKLKGYLAGGQINASGAIENFNHPWLNLNVTSHFNVKALQQFLKLESVDQLKGDLTLNGQFKGPFPNENITLASLKKLKMSGEMNVSELDVHFTETGQSFANLNGNVIFNDNNLNIKALTGDVNQNSFSASGELRGFMHYVFGQQDNLHLVADIKSPHVVLDNFLTEGESSGTGEGQFHLGNKIDFNLNVDVDLFSYKNFEATDIKGKVTISENSIAANNIKFESAKGAINGSISLTTKDNKLFTINSTTDIKHVSIVELFDQFDQFGQEFIQSKHLKGSGDAHIRYTSNMDAGMNIAPNSISCDADVTIRDGELISHPAMTDIYLALKENKLIRPFVKLDELGAKLNHLQFSNLQNKIKIKNGNINIPEMSIASNAMNINIAGEHSFENEIDYQFNFKLSEILIRREQSEFGTIADDGTGSRLFMRMYGTTDNPSFEIDRAGAKEKRREELLVEKEKFKTLLKEEVGLFKNHDGKQKFEKEKEAAPIITVEEAKPENKKDKSIVKDNTMFIYDNDEVLEDDDF